MGGGRAHCWAGVARVGWQGAPGLSGHACVLQGPCQSGQRTLLLPRHGARAPPPGPLGSFWSESEWPEVLVAHERAESCAFDLASLRCGFCPCKTPLAVSVGSLRCWHPRLCSGPPRPPEMQVDAESACGCSVLTEAWCRIRLRLEPHPDLWCFFLHSWGPSFSPVDPKPGSCHLLLQEAC